MCCSFIGCFRSFIYQPTALTQKDIDPLLLMDHRWTLETVSRSQDVNLVGLIAKPHPDKDVKPIWVLFFGGNSMNLAQLQAVLSKLDETKHWGFATFAYRGYDLSTGTPTQADLWADANFLVEHLVDRHGVVIEHLFIMGYSLGTGIASHVAYELGQSSRPPAGLILLAPYTSMAQIFDDHLPLIPIGWSVADPYETEEFIADIKSPVLILHGSNDTLISIEHSQTLARLLGPKATFIPLPKYAHNNIFRTGAPTIAHIHQFIASCIPDS